MIEPRATFKNEIRENGNNVEEVAFYRCKQMFGVKQTSIFSQENNMIKSIGTFFFAIRIPEI